MKVRLITTRAEINLMKPKEKAVYFSFRPSSVDLINLILKSPGLRMIQVPGSHLGKQHNAIDIFLKVLDINVLDGNKWGNVSNIECLPVSDESVNTS